MPDLSIMDVQGVQPAKPSKYSPICTLKWIGGFQTQRSPFMSLDTRYNSRFLGGKPDALIDGYNVELSNKLTLTRRPGLLEYGTTSIPAPDYFFSWQQAALAAFVSEVDPTYQTYPQGNLQLIIDTADEIYNYSPTHAGVIVEKSNLSQQTSLYTVVDTMYMGDGIDLYKQVGVNLLTYSNDFSNAVGDAWASTDAAFTTGQTDPTGGVNATEITWSTTGSGVNLTQGSIVPNYTPMGSNVFTFSVWLKADAAQTIYLFLNDSNGSIVQQQETLTTSWALYQITGTASSNPTSLNCGVYDPSSDSAHTFIYGAQLEVGGPATPTTITLNKPNGVYLWGIEAPTSAPSFTFTPQYGSTGQSWLPNTEYSQTSASVTAIAAVGSLAAPVTIMGTIYTVGATYTATFSGGASNGLQGRYFSALPGSGGDIAAANQTLGTANPKGLPGFLCLESTSTTLTLYNTQATHQASLTGTNTMTLLDTIVDSNGNLEVAYTPGKSGGVAPIWNVVQGLATPDGLQNLIVQYNSVQINGSTGSVSFPTTVTIGDTILVFVCTSNSSGIATPSLTGATLVGPIDTNSTSNIGIFLYYRLSAAGTETGISFTGGGSQATWIGVAEIANQTAIDEHATNRSTGTTSVVFDTGSVATTNALDVLISFAEANTANGTQGYSQLNLPTIPSGWQTIVNQAPTPQGTGYWNQNAAFTVLTATQSVNPTWLITDPTTNSNDGYAGITAAFKSSVGTLVWYNLGPFGLTSTSATNYQWGYSFVNSYTGQRSNVSPMSLSSGTFAGQAINVSGPGMQTIISGPYNADPQVDAIEVYRNTDGGGFWYQVPPALLLESGIFINGVQITKLLTDAFGNQYIPNPGSLTSVGTWRVIDTVPDSSLNTEIYAPIGYLNSPPPAGLTNLEFFSGRLWGSVGNILYYATGTDDATLLNILTNGVSAESWEPTNYITFNSTIVRSVATGVGLLVFTTTDVWIVTGSNLASYQPYKQLSNIGIGSYNALCVDGSNIMMYTRDRECLMFAVTQGASEMGFVIGDFIEDNINPMTAYLARHVAGSTDNAFYLGTGPSGFADIDGTPSGWLRLNPNQYGASVSGEQAPIWSPPAYITGGCGAIASIEVTPGVKKLLVGGISSGPVLVRDLDTFQDNGTGYDWSATIGSIMLALPSRLAITESITTEMVTSESTQCGVAVLLDEIEGDFETLTYSTNDPPQLPKSTSVISNRFYLSVGTIPPVCRHMQIQLTGTDAATEDELLALTIRGEIINEQD